MADTWQQEYRTHPLWAKVRSTLQLLETDERLEDSLQYRQLLDILRHISSYEDTPQITITSDSLSNVEQIINRFEKSKYDIARAFDPRHGGVSPQRSIFSQLIRAARLWPPIMESKLAEIDSRIEAATAELSALHRQVNGRVDELERTASGRIEEYISHVQDRLKAADQELAKLTGQLGELVNQTGNASETINAQTKRLDDELARHKEQFDRDNADRHSQWESELASVQQSAEAHEQLMQEYQQKAANVLEAVGVNATANDYASYANDQNKRADVWRRWAVSVFGVAGAIFIFVMFMPFINPEQPLEWWAMISQRIGAPVGLAGIAFFFARESGLHRKEARAAKQTQLKIAAMEPFIVNLKENIQNEVRVMTAETIFAQQADDRAAHKKRQNSADDTT